jgi:hypothetical protein
MTIVRKAATNDKALFYLPWRAKKTRGVVASRSDIFTVGDFDQIKNGFIGEVWDYNGKM